MGIIYVCAKKNCNKEIPIERLENMPGIKCPFCGYRILYKKRPELLTKKVKAR